MADKKTVERNKRFLFLGVSGAGVATTALATAWVGLPLIGVGAFLGYDWFKYRVKNGMRF